MKEILVCKSTTVLKSCISAEVFNLSLVLNDDWHILGMQRPEVERVSGDVQGLWPWFSCDPVSMSSCCVLLRFCHFTYVHQQEHRPHLKSSWRFYSTTRENITHNRLFSCYRKKPWNVFCFMFSNVLESGVSEKEIKVWLKSCAFSHLLWRLKAGFLFCDDVFDRTFGWKLFFSYFTQNAQQKHQKQDNSKFNRI